MFSIVSGYKSPQHFAKEYTTPKGRKGVTRAYINQLIMKEKAQPGSTGLDVIEIDGNYYVKSSK